MQIEAGGSARRALGENALQSAPVHRELARGFRDIAIAGLVDALNMLPADAIGGHRMLGALRTIAAGRHQRGENLVGVDRLGEIVESAELDRRDGGCDRAVARQYDGARVRPRRLEFAHDVEAAAVAKAKVDDRKGRRVIGDRRETFADAARKNRRKPPALHRSRQPRGERLIVIDDQQGFIRRGRGDFLQGFQLDTVHLRAASLSRDHGAPFYRLLRPASTLLEGRAAPGDCRNRADARLRAIHDLGFRAGSLQQSLGDEQPKSEAAAGSAALIAFFAARRDIGLAEPRQDVRRDAWAIVGDDNLDRLFAPRRADADLLLGEIRRVLHDVAQAIEHAWITTADGLRRLAAGLDVDRHAWSAMRRDDLLDELADRQFIERPGAVFAKRGKLAEDASAAADFLSKQGDVIGEWTWRRLEPLHLVRHQGKRGERRAK